MANLLKQLQSEGYDTSQITPDLIKQLKQEGFDTSGIEQPSKKSGIFSKLGSAVEKANVPARGFRGMAVGAENLMRPMGGPQALLGPLNALNFPPTAEQAINTVQNAPNALNRAAAAVQPGFEPQDAREGLAADIGYEGATTAMLPGIGKVAGKGVSVAGRGIKHLSGRALQGSATQKLSRIQNTLDNLPTEKLAKEKVLEETRKIASKAIGEARSAAQVPQKLHDVSKVDVNKFANMMGSLQPKTKNMKTLLSLRDRADAMLRKGVDSTQEAFIRRGMRNIDAALAKTGDKGRQVAEAYKQYGEVMAASDDVAGDILKKRVANRKMVRELKPEADREKLRRKFAAGAVGLGGGAAGMWGLFK
jgi:hypothetical protein